MTPTCHPFIESSLADEKPVSANICIAVLSWSFVSKSSTAWRTYSKDSRLEIGGTNSSESKASESPTSVRTGLREVVAMTRRRWPCMIICQLDDIALRSDD